jgi:urea transport system substrate-binding protein
MAPPHGIVGSLARNQTVDAPLLVIFALIGNDVCDGAAGDGSWTSVAAFKAKYGKDAVIGDVTQAGYLGPWLWKAAVERAKSFDVVKVTAASPGIELKTAPEGYVKLDANHHLWSKSRIAIGMPDATFKVVSESPNLIKPDPFPKGYQ